ncbi:unnamed protein product, partial [Trichobilharzia regenti]
MWPEGIPETDASFEGKNLALSHLDDVIDSVVSEAIEYADKPPEERTLPKLIRKAPPPPRVRPSLNMNDFNQARNFATPNGLNQMPFLAASGPNQFQQKLNEPFPTMVPFNSGQVTTAAQQQLLMQYNGQYPAQQQQQQRQQQQQQQQQQYSQAAHFQALQNQQAQYQAVNAAALAQMQQLQRQQMQVYWDIL